MLAEKKRTAFIINVFGFGLTGLVYFIIYFTNITSVNETIYHPLLSGWAGIWISIFGSLSVFYYLKYGTLYIARLVIYSIVLSLIYFFAFFFIGNFFTPLVQGYLSTIWIGILFVLYFVFLGGVNGYFGMYIAATNIIITVLSLQNGFSNINPAIWVDVLNLAGIDNAYLQWGIVFISGILGLTDKGLELFDLFN